MSKDKDIKKRVIMIPFHLSDEEKEDALNSIEEMEDKNPSCENDYILIDEINGDINIKWFYKEEIEKIAKTTPEEVLLFILRQQNKNAIN